jgi:hypothetical protein
VSCEGEADGFHSFTWALTSSGLCRSFFAKIHWLDGGVANFGHRIYYAFLLESIPMLLLLLLLPS